MSQLFLTELAMERWRCSAQRFISGKDGGTGVTEEKKREEFSQSSAENKQKKKSGSNYDDPSEI